MCIVNSFSFYTVSLLVLTIRYIFMSISVRMAFRKLSKHLNCSSKAAAAASTFIMDTVFLCKHLGRVQGFTATHNTGKPKIVNNETSKHDFLVYHQHAASK